MTLPVITRLKFEEDRTKYDHSTVFSFHENIRADLQKKAHASNVCCFLDGNNVFSNASLSPNQDELKLALKQGTTLFGCIKEQAAKSESHRLNPDEIENQTTVER